MSVMKSRTSCATSHSWRNVTSSPGSRSKTMRVAGPGIFSAPSSRLHESMNRHCGTCTSSDACWAIHARPSTVSMTGYVVVPDRWVDALAVQPVGRGAGELLLEERRLVDAVGPALAGDGAACDVRDHRLGDVDVVVEHLRLGGTRRRVQHLVRVCQLHPAELIHHANVIPAVPLNDEAIIRCLPDGGCCRGNGHSDRGRRSR